MRKLIPVCLLCAFLTGCAGFGQKLIDSMGESAPVFTQLYPEQPQIVQGASSSVTPPIGMDQQSPGYIRSAMGR